MVHVIDQGGKRNAWNLIGSLHYVGLYNRRQSLPVSGRQERQLGQPTCRS